MVNLIWRSGFLLLLMTTLKVSCEFLLIKEENITGTYRKSIAFSFTVNISSTDKETLTNLNIWALNKIIATGTPDHFTSFRLPPFGSRLTVSKSNNRYNLEITDLSYDDAGILTGLLIYDVDKNDDQNEVGQVSKNIRLIIKGGPHLCNGTSDLPERTSLNFSSTRKINITLCGNQKPLLKWTINGTELTETTSYNTSFLHGYIYSLTLPNVTSLCGNRLRYLATGYEADVRGSTILDIVFKPLITIREVKADNQCITINWEKIDIGNCTGLQYEVVFVDIENKTLSFPSLNQTVSSLKYCRNISDMKIAKVRGVFSTEIGEWSQQNIVFPPTTTFAPTTTTPAATTPAATTTKNTTLIPGKTEDDDNNDMMYIIIGAALGGLIFLVLIILIFIYCCKKRNKNDNFHQMNSIHEYHHKNASSDEVKTNPPSTITHPTKIINNNDLEKGETNNAYEDNRAYEFTNDRYDQEEKEFDSTDDEEALEVVSAAQLKYYDPEEFGLSSGEKNVSEISTPTGNADKAKSIEVDDGKEHIGYPRDEFESDEDDYENYNKNFKADQYPAEKYQNFEGNKDSEVNEAVST